MVHENVGNVYLSVRGGRGAIMSIGILGHDLRVYIEYLHY